MLSGCMAFADTWQVYNLAKIENKLGIDLMNPGKLIYTEPSADKGSLDEDEQKYKALQYAFCQPTFNLWAQDPKNPDFDKRIKGGKLADGSTAPKKADAVLG